MNYTDTKYWYPYVSPYDPCKPTTVKSYSTPPNLYLDFQPSNLPQFQTAKEALFHGTLWPDLYSAYDKTVKRGDEN